VTRVDELRSGGLIVLLLAGALAAGGCDSSGSKRDSLYQQLSGTWRVQEVRLRTSRINIEDPALVEFGQQDEQRSYHIIRSPMDTTRRGRVSVPRSNLLSMTTGFRRPLLWSFTFDEPDPTSTSVRLRLESNWEGSSQAFLNAVGIGGGARILAIDLERE
jgi:hypothetical protein